MSLIHRSDELTANVVAVECHKCHARFSGDQLAEIATFDQLRCLDCGTGGLIPRTASRLGERFPEPLTTRFTPLPEALMDHASALGIGPHELVLIWALERHRRLVGDEVFPGRATLANLTQLSEDQVKRASTSLVAKGLITRRQPGKAKASGRAANRYRLDQLWLRVAELEGAPAPQTPFGVHMCPQAEPGAGLRADEDPFAGAGDTVWGAPVHPEVDVKEVEVFEIDPPGTSPASPEPAGVGGLEAEVEQDEHDVERWQAFQVWRSRHPRIINIADAWAQYQKDSIEAGSDGILNLDSEEAA